MEAYRSAVANTHLKRHLNILKKTILSHGFIWKLLLLANWFLLVRVVATCMVCKYIETLMVSFHQQIFHIQTVLVDDTLETAVVVPPKKTDTGKVLYFIVLILWQIYISKQYWLMIHLRLLLLCLLRRLTLVRFFISLYWFCDKYTYPNSTGWWYTWDCCCCAS